MLVPHLGILIFGKKTKEIQYNIIKFDLNYPHIHNNRGNKEKHVKYKDSHSPQRFDDSNPWPLNSSINPLL